MSIRNVFLLLLSLPLIVSIPLNACRHMQRRFKCDVPYEVLMGLSQFANPPLGSTIREKDKEEIAALAKVYSDNLQSAKKAKQHIPHVIHFIWLGTTSFPQTFVRTITSWKNLHPKWKLMFWTESKTGPLPIPGMIRRHVNTANLCAVKACFDLSTNPQEKQTLLALAVLFNEGGLYADPNVACRRSFNRFADFFDFVVCNERMQFHENIDSFIVPDAKLFLAKPGHPILSCAMKYIAERWEAAAPMSPVIDPTHPIQQAACRTPDSFALACKHAHNKGKNRDLILPTAYFFSQSTFNQSFLRQLDSLGYTYTSTPSN